MSSLVAIGLSGNQLSGNLPSTLGHSLPNLDALFLSNNKLTGTIPSSVTNTSKISALELASNSFSGIIPNTFGNLRFLTILNLMENQLTAATTQDWSFLSSLTNCRYLNYLALNSNPLGGVLPPLIGNFSASLEQFFAYECKLKGSIPLEIGNLSGLISLSISINDFTGTIPTTIARLQKLQALDLSTNNLEGLIPIDLCNLERLSGLYLTRNKLSGPIPSCLANLVSLRYLYLSSNKLNSGIPSSLWSLEHILEIDMSSNSLNGSLPSDVQHLKNFIFLHLSGNQLSGVIPLTIGALRDLKNLSLAGNRFQGLIPESFGNLSSLEFLDLSSNNLSGKIPKSIEALSHLKQVNLSDNHALCGPPRFHVPHCKEVNSKGASKSKNKAAIIYSVMISSVLVAVVVIIIFIIIRNKRAKRATRNLNHQEDVLPDLATWRRTSYLDIQRATDGFNECNLLGKGSFGSVYKATLSDGDAVAVKVFNLQLERAYKSFDSECEVLRSVRHRNLVKIISSCSNTDFRALVLEFMPNGSLEKWLYSHNCFLDILQRLNVMIDVGLALEYLHDGHSSSAPVAHCDLKPSNILLDEDMVAHVSDFGISKLLGEGDDDSVTQTMTMATIGYMAPEYGSEGIVSTKCDVYSYGILLMETFTRKKPTDEMFTEEMSLKKWVNESMLLDGLTEVVDANLLDEEEQNVSAKMECLLSIMHLALNCCMDSPDERMCMRDAVPKLKKIKVKFQDDVNACN